MTIASQTRSQVMKIIASVLAGLITASVFAQQPATQPEDAAAEPAKKPSNPVAASSEDDLAKQLQNPVANLISVPFQFNWDFGLGPSGDGTQFKLNFQPVVPVSIGKDWNLIIRTIVPYISQTDVFKGTTPPGVPEDRNQDGLGDIVQSFFFSPKEPVGGLILGVGPALLYPSATDSLLGSGKWGAGPTGVVLKQTGPWTIGVLANQIWSYAGNDNRRSVNATFFQPFLTYTTKTKTTFGVNAESTYDWNESQWTFPINAFVSQLIKVGKLPVSLSAGVRYYAEGSSSAPDWGVRFVVTPLFPLKPKPKRIAGENSFAK